MGIRFSMFFCANDKNISTKEMAIQEDFLYNENNLQFQCDRY